MIILCEAAQIQDEKLCIKNYSVVNGAQSITTFYNSKSKLTDDLRVLVRVIALKDDALARKITEYSNNQNAIKPRDLRSGHTLMTRLQIEMTAVSDDFFFEIKRGEQTPKGKTAISNEAAGRALLAIDLCEPYSCHQNYKIFDDKYAEIFGRQEVNAARVIHVMSLMRLIDEQIDGIKLKPMAHYALTRYFLASVLAIILRSYDSTSEIMRNPTKLEAKDVVTFHNKCKAIVASLIIDLNYEVEAKKPTFDYKGDLKSPKQVEDLTNLLLKSYQKDVARGKAESFESWPA